MFFFCFLPWNSCMPSFLSLLAFLHKKYCVYNMSFTKLTVTVCFRPEIFCWSSLLYWVTVDFFLSAMKYLFATFSVYSAAKKILLPSSFYSITSKIVFFLFLHEITCLTSFLECATVAICFPGNTVSAILLVLIKYPLTVFVCFPHWSIIVWHLFSLNKLSSSVFRHEKVCLSSFCTE